MSYLEIKTEEPTEDVMLKVINIQSSLVLVNYEKNYTKKMFELMKDTHDKDFVILKINGIFTSKELADQELLRFNGHTLSFIDKNFLKKYKVNLLSFLDSLATIRSKGHYTRRNKKNE